MKKELEVTNAFHFVTAVSGVFITTGNPNGLTFRERQVTAVLLELLDGGTINPRIQKDLWQEFKKAVNLKTQAMSNMMNTLKQKKVVTFHNGVYDLHPILRRNEELAITYRRKEDLKGILTGGEG